MPPQTANQRLVLSDDRINNKSAPVSSIVKVRYTPCRLPQHRTGAALRLISNRLRQQILHGHDWHAFASPLERVLFFYPFPFSGAKRSHPTNSSRCNAVELLARS